MLSHHGPSNQITLLHPLQISPSSWDCSKVRHHFHTTTNDSKPIWRPETASQHLRASHGCRTSSLIQYVSIPNPISSHGIQKFHFSSLLSDLFKQSSRLESVKQYAALSNSVKFFPRLPFHTIFSHNGCKNQITCLPSSQIPPDHEISKRLDIIFTTLEIHPRQFELQSLILSLVPQSLLAPCRTDPILVVPRVIPAHMSKLSSQIFLYRSNSFWSPFQTVDTQEQKWIVT